jgi:gliding motility-associated-like protein
LYGTFFGQLDPIGKNSPETFGDHVDGGTSRFDKFGVIYQAMCANCGRTVNFYGTPGSWSTSNQANSGASCNIGMLKIEMNFAGVVAAPKASIEGVADTSGCIPLTVDFSDTLQRGKTYVWDFGDQTPKITSNDYNISHTYTAVGNYKVMLVAIDSTTCNIADTAYLNIKAGNNKALIGFVASKLLPCTNLTYQFDNTSTSFSNNFGSQSFTWDFGDGSAPLLAGVETINHTYAGPGTYKVTLTLLDSSFCNSPDDSVKVIRLSPVLDASFNTPPNGCLPYTAVFENTSLGGLSFMWDFGDGTSSTEDNPSHLYSVAGNYTVRLFSFDSTSCNVVDSASKTISVSPVPVASFIFDPTVPTENTFTQFTDQSTGAISHLWRFEDGDTSIERNPRHIFPNTGTFNVCLTVQNEAGCSDDTCQPVQSLIRPLLDVPNAFTPGKFGTNSVIKVTGFGIADMQWKIYNRWGQNVFESRSQKLGWDGRFNGKIQPIDVYSYTLDVVFSDGKKLRKTGDITLLR